MNELVWLLQSLCKQSCSMCDRKGSWLVPKMPTVTGRSLQESKESFFSQIHIARL